MFPLSCAELARRLFDSSKCTFLCRLPSEMSEPSPPVKKKLKVAFNEENTLTADLWHKREFTDVVFSVADREFPAHKIVLAAQSEYFRALLYGNMQEGSMSSISLPEEIVPPGAFEKVLQYCYTKSLEIDEPLEDILDVLRAADYFRLDGLKTVLGEHLTKLISHDTVMKIYAYHESNNLQLPGLSNPCLEFFSNTVNTVAALSSPEFLELPQEQLTALLSRDTFLAPEGEILQAVLRWKEHNEKSVDEMEEVVRCVRLSRFTTKEMFTAVKPSGLISDADVLAAIEVITMPILSGTKPRGIKLPEENLLECARFSPSKQDQNIWFSFGAAEFFDDDDDHMGEISLPRKYLANHLCFEVVNGQISSDPPKRYYYHITMCLDDRREMVLFDYSHCRGQQNLYFPTIPIRSIKINIYLHKESSAAVIMHSLQYTEACIQFKFMKNGVIAPLCDYKVYFVHFNKVEKDIPTAVAYFKQPYSASKLIHQHVTEADIALIVGKIKGKRLKFKMSKVDIRSPVAVTFNESVIELVSLTVTSTYISNEKDHSDPATLEKLEPVKEPTVTITSICCRSSATTDDVKDMVAFTSFLTAT